MKQKKIPLKFIAYTHGYESGMLINNQNDFLKHLEYWGFKINPFNRLIKNTKKLMQNYHEIENKRDHIRF